MGASESRHAGEILWKASKAGDIEGMKSILNHPQGTHVLDWRHPTSGHTILMIAAAYGRIKAVTLLLESYRSFINVNAVNTIKDGNTALHYAASKNHVAVIRKLLSATCATPSVLNSAGHSPIDLARFKDYRESEAALTKVLRVHSGWMYVRTKASQPLSRWKHRYCQLLQYDDDSRELAFYRQPDLARPTHVILFKPSNKLQGVLKRPSSWTDKSHMFSFSHATVVQKPYLGYFSRDSSIRAHFTNVDFTPEVVKFAADGADEAHNWIRICNGDNLVGCGVADNTDPLHSPLFPKQSEVIAPSAPVFDEECLFPTSSTCSSSATIDVSPPSYESLFSSKKEDKEEEVPQCVICMDGNRDAVSVPCGHVSSCFDCLTSLKDQHSGCPICRQNIDSVVRIYNS